MTTKSRWTACVAAGAWLLLFSGCENKPGEEQPPPGSPPAAPQTVTPPPAAKSEAPAVKTPAAPGGGATITGKVVFQGTPPKPKQVNFGPEKNCAELHKDAPLFYETMVVNSNSTLKWALVSIEESVPGNYQPPAAPLVINQVGCNFIPHVAAMLAGQEVEFAFKG
ncbi:MAG: hypothetical protein HY717_01375 [Planctomycetes bacterium]|nr:hypothetical protein [Planctomycetota bacterium]